MVDRGAGTVAGIDVGGTFTDVFYVDETTGKFGVAKVQSQMEDVLTANPDPGSIAAVILAIVLLLAWRTQRVTVRVWMIVAVLGLLWSWQLFKYATGRPL